MSFNMDHFKLIFEENWNMVSGLLEVNERIISDYFSNMDLKIYYGDNNIAQPIEYLKSIYQEIIASSQLLEDSKSDYQLTP